MLIFRGVWIRCLGNLLIFAEISKCHPVVFHKAERLPRKQLQVFSKCKHLSRGENPKSGVKKSWWINWWAKKSPLAAKSAVPCWNTWIFPESTTLPAMSNWLSNPRQTPHATVVGESGLVQPQSGGWFWFPSDPANSLVKHWTHFWHGWRTQTSVSKNIGLVVTFQVVKENSRDPQYWEPHSHTIYSHITPLSIPSLKRD